MIASKNELIERPPELVTSSGPDAPPAPGRISRVLYGAGYYVSFSVTLPTLLAANLVPRNSVVRQGFRDGAAGAGETHERLKTHAAAAATATRDKVGGAYASVAARVSERVEGVQDAIAERKYRRRIAMA